MTIMEDRPIADEVRLLDDRPRNVVAALARVMAEMGGIDKLSPQQRAQRGMGGGDQGISYAYRGIDQIAGAAQPLLGRYGVVIVPNVLESRTDIIMVKDRPWSDTWVRVEWNVYGPGGVDDRIVAVTEGLGRDMADKGPNKAITAASKNLLLRLLMIGDSSDDSDGHTYERDKEQPPDTRPQPLSDQWLNSFRQTVTDTGLDPDAVMWAAFGNMVPDPLMPEHVQPLRDAFRRLKEADDAPELRHDETKRGGTPPEVSPDELPLGSASEDVPPVTRPQIARIKSEYDRIGYDRTQQLEYTASIAGREVKTHNQLTWAEAETLIEALSHITPSTDKAET